MLDKGTILPKEEEEIYLLATQRLSDSARDVQLLALNTRVLIRQCISGLSACSDIVDG